MHRLPPFLGHVSSRRARRCGDRGRERPARPHRRDLHGDGDRKHHGLHDGGAGDDAAGRRDHPRGARGPRALRRALGKAGRPDRGRGPAPGADHDRGRVPQCPRHPPGDRRLDERTRAHHRGRAPARDRDRPRGVRFDRPPGAGPRGSQALRRPLHGAPARRGRAERGAAGAALGAPRRHPHRIGPDPRREHRDRRSRPRADGGPDPERPHPSVGGDGGAPRQPRPRRGGHQALRRLAPPPGAHRARGGVRFARGPRGARRRPGSRRRAGRRPRAPRGGAEGRARHAGGGLHPDPEEARRARRQGHGAALGRTHERHRVRHHRAARHPGVGARGAARPRRDRRPDPTRRRRAAPRPARAGGGDRGTPRAVVAAPASPRFGARLPPPVPRHRDRSRPRLRLRLHGPPRRFRAGPHSAPSAPSVRPAPGA